MCGLRSPEPIAEDDHGRDDEERPADEGGLRYCINSAALRFVHLDDLESEGYGAYRRLFQIADGAPSASPTTTVTTPESEDRA